MYGRNGITESKVAEGQASNHVNVIDHVGPQTPQHFILDRLSLNVCL